MFQRFGLGVGIYMLKNLQKNQISSQSEFFTERTTQEDSLEHWIREVEAGIEWLQVYMPIL